MQGAILTVVVAAVVATFYQVLGHEFVWDDRKLLVSNPAYRALGREQLGWMLTTFLMGHWMPLTWITLGLDYLLWGLNPFGYHLTNLVLHSANAVAFYFVARRLLDGSWAGGASAALLFALHPLRVESVAWITERRDVLSGLGYLLTVLLYLRACEARSASRRRSCYWSALALFAMALCAKGIVLTLPLILLVLDVYPLRRLGGAVGWATTSARRVWLEKIPFGVLGMVSAAITLLAIADVRSSLAQLSLPTRLAVAAHGAAFYLWKTLVPTGLVPLYELPSRIAAGPVIVGATTVVAVSALALAMRRRWPGLLAAWVAFVVTLLPVSGLFQAGPQLAADRYTYLATLGFAVLGGAAVRWGYAAAQSGRLNVRLAGAAIILALIATMGVLTWRQVGIWRDEETLWTHTIETWPSTVAYYNRGRFLVERGQYRRAMEDLRKAIASAPGFVDAYNDLGLALLGAGAIDEAVDQFRQALAISPGYASAHHNLAKALAVLDRRDEAIQHLHEALVLSPKQADSHNNLGILLAQSGRLDEAIAHFRQAARLDTDLADAHYNWGVALSMTNRWEEAAVHFEQALQIRPSYARARAALDAARNRLAASPRFQH